MASRPSGGSRYFHQFWAEILVFSRDSRKRPIEPGGSSAKKEKFDTSVACLDDKEELEDGELEATVVVLDNSTLNASVVCLSEGGEGMAFS